MTSPHKAIPPHLRFRVNRRIIDSAWGSQRFLAARATMRPLMVGPESAIVIDGFPRSANSFAYYAFRQANPDVPLAGHTHSAQTIRAGAERGLPTVLLAREPIGVTASLVQFVPGLDPRDALRAYLRFHTTCLTHVDRVLVTSFDDVTADFGHVIGLVNARWGTEFALPLEDAQADKEVRADLVASNQRYYGGSESTAPIPTSSRHDRGSLEAGIAARAPHELARAQRLYAGLTGR